MAGIVERRSPEAGGVERAADDDDRGAGDFRGAHLAANVGERAADDALVGPGRAMHDRDRTVRPVARGQFLADPLQIADRQMDRKGSARHAESLEILVVRHRRRLHRGSRQDHRLRDARQRQLPLQNGRRRRVGGNAGNDLVCNAQGVETAHLLAGRAVERRVARMHARHVPAFGMGRRDLSRDLVERHRRGVHDPRPRRGVRDHRRRHQRSGVEADRASRNGQQVGSAGPGADEPDRHPPSAA